MTEIRITAFVGARDTDRHSKCMCVCVCCLLVFAYADLLSTAISDHSSCHKPDASVFLKSWWWYTRLWSSSYSTFYECRRGQGHIVSFNVLMEYALQWWMLLWQLCFVKREHGELSKAHQPWLWKKAMWNYDIWKGQHGIQSILQVMMKCETVSWHGY